jgi:hypothetical protein
MTLRRAVYRVPDAVIAAELEDEVVLLHLGARAYFRLNPSATAIWQGVERGVDRAAMLDDICSHFEVERDTASSDLDHALEDLLAQGLIESVAFPT